MTLDLLMIVPYPVFDIYTNCLTVIEFYLYHSGMQLVTYNKNKMASEPGSPREQITKYFDAIYKVIPKSSRFFIAGGSVRKAFQNIDLDESDIDLFFASESDYQLARKFCKLPYVRTVVLTENAHTMILLRGHLLDPDFDPDACYDAELLNEITIQFVFKYFVKYIHTVFEYFDLSVCKLVYYNGHFVLPASTEVDLRQRVMRYTGSGDIMNKIDHIIKYGQLGFAPSTEMFEELFLKTKTITKTTFYVQHHSDQYDGF